MFRFCLIITLIVPHWRRRGGELLVPLINQYHLVYEAFILPTRPVAWNYIDLLYNARMSIKIYHLNPIFDNPRLITSRDAFQFPLFPLVQAVNRAYRAVNPKGFEKLKRETSREEAKTSRVSGKLW